MVVTVTLNPAIDKTCKVGKLHKGNVNRMDKVERIAGGKGVNVTKILRQFGYPVKAIGFLAGTGGKFIEETLLKMGAECDFTYVEGETRVSTNIIEDDGRVTEILEPGFAVSTAQVEEFVACFGERIKGASVVVFSGSLPVGVPKDIYKRLITVAKEQGCKTFLDTSQEALREGIESCPYFIKPNLVEMEWYVEKILEDTGSIAECARALIGRGISKVVITLGKDGLIAVEKDRFLCKDAYDVAVKNTVGCGDTVVASYVISELENEDFVEAVERAGMMAAAAAADETNGQVCMSTFEKLLKS